MAPPPNAAIKSCLRCANDDDDNMSRHYLHNDGLKRCQKEFPWKTETGAQKVFWPEFIKSETLSDQQHKDKHAQYLEDLKKESEQDPEQGPEQDPEQDPEQVELQGQALAKALLHAAHKEEKSYQRMPLTKELLEGATSVLNFPETFTKDLRPTASFVQVRSKKSKKKASATPLPSHVKAHKASNADKDRKTTPLTDAAADSNAATASTPSGLVSVANSSSGLGSSLPGSNTPVITAPKAKSSLEKYAHRNRVYTTTGQPLVFTNHFSIKLEAGQKLYEYEIQGLEKALSEKDLSKPKKRVLIERMIDASEFLKNQKAAFATDYDRKLISTTDLSIAGGRAAAAVPMVLDTQDIVDYERGQKGIEENKIRLSLVYIRTISLNGLKAFVEGRDESYLETGAAQAMNILIGRGVTDNNAIVIQIGDKRFFPLGDEQPLGCGLVAIKGFFSSVRPGNGQLLLNVNIVTSAFYEETWVSKHMSKWPYFSTDKVAKKHLTGLRVRIRYLRCKPGEDNEYIDSDKGRTNTITGFSDKPAKEIYFTNRDGKQVSVWQHLEANYPTAAGQSNGNQICVNTGSTKPGQECWFLPDQLDVLPGQIYRRTLDRLDSSLTETMLDIASRTPEQNRNDIL